MILQWNQESFISPAGQSIKWGKSLKMEHEQLCVASKTVAAIKSSMGQILQCAVVFQRNFKKD